MTCEGLRESDVGGRRLLAKVWNFSHKTMGDTQIIKTEILEFRRRVWSGGCLQNEEPREEGWVE